MGRAVRFQVLDVVLFVGQPPFPEERQHWVPTARRIPLPGLNGDTQHRKMPATQMVDKVAGALLCSPFDVVHKPCVRLATSVSPGVWRGGFLCLFNPLVFALECGETIGG